MHIYLFRILGNTVWLYNSICCRAELEQLVNLRDKEMRIGGRRIVLVLSHAEWNGWDGKWLFLPLVTAAKGDR